MSAAAVLALAHSVPAVRSTIANISRGIAGGPIARGLRRPHHIISAATPHKQCRSHEATPRQGQVRRPPAALAPHPAGRRHGRH